MRIGFITQLLWSRYGSFWTGLLDDAGFECVYPSAEMTRLALDNAQLAAIDSLSMRLAVAQALSLEDCDAIIAPDLNANTLSARASAQNPWVARFPEALAAFTGHTRVISVPASSDTLESLVVTVLMGLQADVAKVKMLWERHRRKSYKRVFTEPDWTSLVQPPVLGVVGQPWLLNQHIVNGIQAEVKVGQHQLSPEMLRAEGKAFDAKLAPTDLEVFGALRFLGRKGAVDNLLFVSDHEQLQKDILLSRAAAMNAKPFEVVSVLDIVQDLSELIHEVSL